MTASSVPATRNLVEALPSATADEIVDILAGADGVRLERIVSLGQRSPKGFWYDQAEAEWVIVLEGHARLRIEGETEDRELASGDSLYLPPHSRHRVTWTDPGRPTVWLALFISADRHPQPGDAMTRQGG